MHPLAIELRKTARIMTNVVDEKIYIYNIYSEERDQGVVELTRRVGSMESIKKKRKKLGPSVVVSLSFSLSLVGDFLVCGVTITVIPFLPPVPVTFLSSNVVVGVGVTKQKWVDRVSGARSKMWLLLAGR